MFDKLISSLGLSTRNNLNIAEETGKSTRTANATPGNKNASVYQESMEMLAGALTMYIFADLRDMARDGLLEGTSLQDLEAPMTSGQMLEAIKRNKDALVSSKDYEDLEQRITSLEGLEKGDGKDGGLLSNVFGRNKEAKLVEFVDTDAKNEMVHAILVNDARKRVTVVFRGSVTQTDFITDAKLVMTKVDNPVHKLNEKSPEKIKIHSGFNDYLTKKNKKNGTPRIDEILQSVKNLLLQNPTYRLYLTGHSLGGALATLCGFHAATTFHVASCLTTPPIRVISIASPYVGNVKFVLAFQTLERMKLIQHLRVAYKKDVVTLMPVAAPKIGIFSPAYAAFHGAGDLYKHVGMKLLFSSPLPGEFSISFPQDQSSDERYAKEIKDFFEDGMNILSGIGLAFQNKADVVAKYHACENYEECIMKNKDTLFKITIDDLYNNKEIVGDVLNPDYDPQVMYSAKERIQRVMNSDMLKDTFSEIFYGKKKEEDEAR